MTLAELLALPEIPDPMRAVWREDNDPVQIWDNNGRCWSTARIKGELVRYRVPRYDRLGDAMAGPIFWNPGGTYVRDGPMADKPCNIVTEEMISAGINELSNYIDPDYPLFSLRDIVIAVFAAMSAQRVKLPS